MNPEPATRRAARTSLRHRSLTFGVAACTALGLVVMPPAVADEDPAERKREVDREVIDLREDLEHTSTELAAADRALSKTREELAVANKDLEKKEQALGAAEADDARIGKELDVAQANELKIENTIEENRGEQQRTRGVVGDIARESYKQGGLGQFSTTLELLTGGDDAVESMAMARTVMRVQDSTIRRLSTQEAEARAEEDRLVGARREVARLKAEAEASVLRAEDAREDAARAQRQVEELEAQQAEDKKELELRKKAEKADLAKAEKESDKLEKELAERARKAREAREKAEREAREKAAREEAAREQAAKEEAAKEEAARKQAAQEQAAREKAAREEAAREEAARERAAREEAASREASRSTPQPTPVNPAPVVAGGPLIHPVAAPTSSEFGYRLHPILDYERLHAGLDYAAACGTPIVAPYAGTIIKADTVYGLGNRVVIDHGLIDGTNLTSVYGHMSGFERRGGSVEQGQVIGYVGTTGTSTGCHLHWETRENGAPANPRGWL